ncbi:MAG: hypothetical protein R8J85_05175 [Mariprofundales bacterium]
MMKIIQRNPIQNRGVGAGKRASASQKGAFQSVMDDQGDSTVVEKEAPHQQSHQQQSKDNADVMLMLVRQGIDVLDDGLLQIEREGLLSNSAGLASKMGAVRQQLHQIRQTHGANALLDDSETILNVEAERLRQLA